MPSILVIGSINMDMVARIDHIPLQGESVIGDGYSFCPGGKGANSAVAAARLGGEVFFAGCVGEDDYGRALDKILADEGVNRTHLRVTREAPTGLAPILVQRNGQNGIIVFPGANRCIKKEDIPAMFAEKVDAVMMQLEIDEEVVLLASAEAARRGIPVVLDAGPAQPFPVERVRSLFILSPNETETTALTGLPVDTEEEVRAAAKVLKERSGAAYVVIKMGARGAYILGGGLDEMSPSFRIDAVDPTAAGDTFTGAMTLEYLRCGDMRRAVRYACAAGALAATRLGAQPSLPTRDEVDAFLQERAGLAE